MERVSVTLFVQDLRVIDTSASKGEFDQHADRTARNRSLPVRNYDYSLPRDGCKREAPQRSYL